MTLKKTLTFVVSTLAFIALFMATGVMNASEHESLEHCIIILRDVFVAVDFDVALWDSLFASFLLPSSHGTETISTLADVLAFLEIDESSIPPEYLSMSPAWTALERFMVHHPHRHDCLLQIITMTLSRSSTDLYFRYIHEKSQSVNEHVGMLDTAIHHLTQINHQQLVADLLPDDDDDDDDNSLIQEETTVGTIVE